METILGYSLRKDAKIMNILGNDSIFGRFFGKIGDIIFLNILFIIFSIPVVTAGASLTAMEYTFMKQLKENDIPLFRTFFNSFKENFRQATVSWLILLIMWLIIAVDFHAVYKPFSYCFLLVGFVLGFMSVYLFPVIGAFKNTLKNLWIQSFFLAAKNIPFTLLMCLIIIAPVYLTLSSGIYFMVFISLWLVFGFGLIGYILSFIFLHIFKPYL
jgi:uncharacterized membrane protein YesL